MQRRIRVLELNQSSDSSDEEDRPQQFYQDFLAKNYEDMSLDENGSIQGIWSKRLIRGIYKRKGQIDEITRSA